MKKKIKEFGKAMKIVGYDFPKEVIKRVVSPSYTHSKIFGKKK